MRKTTDQSAGNLSRVSQWMTTSEAILKGVARQRARSHRAWLLPERNIHSGTKCRRRIRRLLAPTVEGSASGQNTSADEDERDAQQMDRFHDFPDATGIK
jgi:hypothetical protein